MQCTLFSLESNYTTKWYIFKNSTELGKLYDTIPWDELTKLLPEKKNPAGAPAWLPRQGYFGMMFLKHYTGLSDEKLLDSFHTDYAMQLFCGVLLEENEKIKNNSFVSGVRKYLSVFLDVNAFQKDMILNWKSAGDLQNTDILMMDATCFESYIRYPTDVKLTWECIDKIHTVFIPMFCKKYSLKLPQTVYKDKKKKYLGYSKCRKKGHRKTKRIRQTLLTYLEKSISTYKQLQSQVADYEIETKLIRLYTTIETVLKQQKQLLANPKEKVEDRIVSLHKSYLRPIVRGKENKPVEFGMKAHLCQTDGINWLEYHSYSAFNECNRLKTSILSHEIMFEKCRKLAADNIYPINANRKEVTEKGIQTNFPKKGPKETDKKKARTNKKIRNELGKLRSTVLEGSFGNEKNNYKLGKIKALTEGTELIWVVFGIFTANAVLISKRREAKAAKLKAQQLRQFSLKKAA